MNERPPGWKEQYIVQFGSRLETDANAPWVEIIDECALPDGYGKHDLLEVVIEDAQHHHKRIIVTAVVEKYELGRWTT